VRTLKPCSDWRAGGNFRKKRTIQVNEKILEIKELKTYFALSEGILKAVDDVSFSLHKGETLGIIGESGCGKSITAHSILRILQPPGKIVSGEIIYRVRDDKWVDLVKQDPGGRFMRGLRGNEIAMIFQEPMASMSPIYTIGSHLVEAILVHHPKLDIQEAQGRAIEILSRVGMPNPKQRMNDYPHQLSGGMCQRAMIAIALVNQPSILIADEPTTALDVTVQAQIVALMKDLQQQFGMSIIYITHDMGLIAETADNIAVMYLGRVVERAGVKEIFKNPLHPYTVRLLKSIPKLGEKSGSRLDAIKGNVPVPLNSPPECGFYSRCLEAKPGICNQSIPPLVEISAGHFVRCFI
jgi:oligopeptide/dipeptide ABC transporter ATP-binding protein